MFHPSGQTYNQSFSTLTAQYETVPNQRTEIHVNPQMHRQKYTGFLKGSFFSLCCVCVSLCMCSTGYMHIQRTTCRSQFLLPCGFPGAELRLSVWQQAPGSLTFLFDRSCVSYSMENVFSIRASKPNLTDLHCPPWVSTSQKRKDWTFKEKRETSIKLS